MVEDVEELELLLLDDEEDGIGEFPELELRSFSSAAVNATWAGRGTDVVVDDVVRLEVGSPGGGVADGVERTVVPYDREDLSKISHQRRSARPGGEGKRTSSSIRPSTRPEPAESSALCTMKRGLKPVRRELGVSETVSGGPSWCMPRDRGTRPSSPTRADDPACTPIHLARASLPPSRPCTLCPSCHKRLPSRRVNSHAPHEPLPSSQRLQRQTHGTPSYPP